MQPKNVSGWPYYLSLEQRYVSNHRLRKSERVVWAAINTTQTNRQTSLYANCNSLNSKLRQTMISNFSDSDTDV